MKNKNSSIVKSLPEEMLSEILKHAASNSITDYVNATLSCKAFLRASNYDYIFENVSMNKYSFVPWRKSEKIFLKRCKGAMNAEALYRKGMINYFSRKKAESGLRYLKRAVEKGHAEAKYAYGIILICLGGELRKQGFHVVSSFNLANSNRKGFNIISCRSKTEKLLSCMWVYASLSEPNEYSVNDVVDCNCDPDLTATPNSLSSKDQAWEASNNPIDSLPYCDFCFWEREAILFCRTLRKYLISSSR